MFFQSFLQFLPKEISQQNLLKDNPVFREDHLVLGDKLKLYWADFNKACHDFSRQLNSDPSLKEQYQKIYRKLEELKSVPLWIRHNKKITQTTIYAVYEAYLNQNMGHLFTPKNDKLEISFICASGPFKKTSVFECMNPQTYKDFIAVSLLEKKVVSRGFRVRVDSKILFHFKVKNEIVNDLVDLVQISSKGLLFRFNSKQVEKMNNQLGEISFYLDQQFFTDSLNKAWSDLDRQVKKQGHRLLYSVNEKDMITLKNGEPKFSEGLDFYFEQVKHLFIPFSQFHKEHLKFVDHIEAWSEYLKNLSQDKFKDLKIA